MQQAGAPAAQTAPRPGRRRAAQSVIAAIHLSLNRVVRASTKRRHDFPQRLHYFEPEEGEEQMGAVLPWLQQRFAL